MALEGVCVLGDDAELFPTLGSVGVAVGGCLVVAAGFGEGGGGGDEGVLCVWRVGLVVAGEALGDVGVVDGDGGSDERGEEGGVVGVVAYAGAAASSVTRVVASFVFPSAVWVMAAAPRPKTKISAAPASRAVVISQSR